MDNKNFDTKIRLLLSDSFRSASSQIDKQSQQFSMFPVNPFKYYASALLLETLFYLPNRFRQSLLFNSAFIEYKSSETLLLGLMKKMFNLGITPYKPGQMLSDVDPFSIKNFASCYKHFFRSTLVFEASWFTFNSLGYYSLTNSHAPSLTDYGVAFGLGAVSHGLLLSRLFDANLLNHRQDTLGMNKKEFKAEVSRVGARVQGNWATWLRGGVLSMICFPLVQRVSNFLEDNSERLFKRVSPAQAFLNKQTLGEAANEQIEVIKKDAMTAKKFIMNTSDENTLLYALAHAGIFDQEETGEVQATWRVYSRQNLLTASVITAFVAGLVMTPIDLVLWKIKSIQLSPQGAHPQSVIDRYGWKEAVKDLRKIEGKTLLVGPVFFGTVVRFFFLIGLSQVYQNQEIKNSLTKEGDLDL